jgi:hypothetical protein
MKKMLLIAFMFIVNSSFGQIIYQRVGMDNVFNFRLETNSFSRPVTYEPMMLISPMYTSPMMSVPSISPMSTFGLTSPIQTNINIIMPNVTPIQTIRSTPIIINFRNE